MKPVINNTKFGSISIDDCKYDHDVFIDIGGTVKKRKKKLSKAVYGTSHIISVDEAEYIYNDKAKILIIGGGQYSKVKLSDEADDFFKQRDCKVIIESTSDALKIWNTTEEINKIGLFHITC